MSISFAPTVSGHAFSSCLKRSLPSGGFQDMDDTLRRKRSRDQNEGLRLGIASPSSGSRTPDPYTFLQGPKSLQQIKAERSMKTSSVENLERSDRSPSIRKTLLCLSQPSAATTVLKRPKSTKDSERDFEGPKSLAEILKEKGQRKAVINLNGADQESKQVLQQLSLDVVAHTDLEDLEEGEFRPSNTKDDACQPSCPSYSTSSISSASVSPNHDSDVGSKLKSTNAAESQLAAASRSNETTTLGTEQLEDDADIYIDDDAEFDGDIDIDDAQLELFFDEKDFIACKEYVTSCSHF